LLLAKTTAGREIEQNPDVLTVKSSLIRPSCANWKAIKTNADVILTYTVIFSIVPMLETRNTRLHESLQLNSTRIAGGRHAAQRALVVSEVMVSLLLFVGAILLLTTFWKLVHTFSGFAAQRKLMFKSGFTD
jgi:hypothetical protein